MSTDYPVREARRRAAAGKRLVDGTPGTYWLVRIERTVTTNDGRSGRIAGWWAGPERLCEFETARTLDGAAVWPTMRALDEALRSVFADADGMSGVTRAGRAGFRPMQVRHARDMVGTAGPTR